MRSLLASLFMLTVLHVACGRTRFDTSGFGDSDSSAGTGGGGGTGNPLPSASTGGSKEPAGGAAGSISSPAPAGSSAGASAMAGTSATGGSAAGTSMGSRFSVAGTTSVTGGSGGTSRSTASGGSSSSGGSCTEVTACGGDVVGTWEVKSQCLAFDGQADTSYLGLTCVPNVASIKGSLKVTGKLTLGSDKKFNDATTTTGSEDWQLDKSCLILSGIKVSCATLGTIFEGVLRAFGYETMTCQEASGGGCTCANLINTDAVDGRPGGMGILYNDASTRGNYKTNGNKLMIGDSLSYTYCVKGNEMTVSPIPNEYSATPYRGTIVLTRSAVPTGGTGGTGGNGGTTATGGKAASGIGGRTAP